jgi:RHS repeat-associated protein
MEPDARFSTIYANGWYGSIVDQGVESSGLIYLRNRYYDPGSGQFTQQDPIGIAGGGLNVYGFAGGDPVNQSDPLGLCPVDFDGIPCTIARGLEGIAGGFVGGATIGALGGTAVIPGVGTIAGAAGGAAVGSIAGGLAGTTVGLGEDVAFAMDWGSIKRRLVIGGAILVGTAIGKGQEFGKAIRDVIRTEQEAEGGKKAAEDERKRKEKEIKRGAGEPPDKSPRQ